MKRYFLWILPCFFVLAGMGQKANYKQAERFTGKNVNSLTNSARIIPNMINKSEKFWYKYETGDGARFYFVDPKAKLHREMVDRELVAGEMSKLTCKPVNYRDIKLQKVSFSKDNKTVIFAVDSFRVEYNMYSKNMVVKRDSIQKKGVSAPAKKWLPGTYSPNKSHVVYVKNHDLYLFSVKDSLETRLTTDGESKYSYAKMEGKDTTATAAEVMWWKDSKYFVVQRSDKRKLKTLFLVDALAERPTFREFPFVMPGDEFVEQQELYLFDTLNKKQVKLSIEKWKDQTLSTYPARDKSRFFFLRKKRTCDEVDFCRVEPETGEIKVLINEVSKPYFNNEYFNISLLDNGEEFLWWSERTGHGHYYRYDSEGNLKNAITSGAWTVGKLSKVDSTEQAIYFYAYGQGKGECPYFARMNRARIDGKGGVEMLTPEMATHNVSFLRSGYFVDNYSRADLEPRSVVRDRKGKVVVELASPDLKRLYETGWKMPEPFTVKAADGVTDLYGYMWKPFDFDSTRKYPIISYVYPGPHTEVLCLEFTPSGVLNTALAQVGFVVVTFGHRGGSPMRDRWYHTYGYGNLRDYPLADDKYGIEQLADRYAFIDGTKVGIFGHSGGGFMSTAALCTYPDFYTAAVSSSGNHDNNIYNMWWGETHHGITEKKSVEKKKIKSPVTGKDSVVQVEKVKFEWKVATNMELAKNLKGNLLLVTGDADDNVHPANTLRMADALLKAGKNFDMIVLPRQNHGYGGVGADFYQRRMWFHFAKHLLGDYSCEEFSEIDAYMRRDN